ncbi:lysine-2,3-aminomutase-like protein [Phreatobacter cathodiphilus]|uniref:Lysine-2,3-aminomutase-like protein n=1 Tax=Phreatobacter cathodiphilus TaxID=1868589 RepID=A0A2S0NH87_9HYPH|nr:lysine-2,3-aminomutase-like protein [Phreatobacter cathodiphilus]AVO47291.1 lysine-2,3-aminomutase-like protein [Phreatobacter cathodiphilus]
MTRPDRTLRTAADLVAAGLIAPAAAADAARVGERYAVAVTPAMAALIAAAGGADPVARQFLPDIRELDSRPEERADPIGDEAHSPLPGIVHRYPDRVLLKIVHVCPVYCRFCFRREMVGPGGKGALDEAELAAALAYIAARPEIFEVILTGGDPFVLSARRVRELTRAIAAIPHVQVIRWHTRVPVVAPERVTADLARALRAAGKAVYVAIHANHSSEFTPAACEALARLADAGIALVSQSVLLRGVNDDPDTLAALMRAFLANRVKPYYLHHPDMAPGTAHFRLSVAEGQALMRALRGRLSGLAQPTYVLDIPGGEGKVPVGPAYFGDGEVADWRGARHPYPPVSTKD